MMRTFTWMTRAVLCGAMIATAAAPAARAQNLGPQRQFLAVEPYYELTRVDRGSGLGNANASGVGARLWINGAPFHFPLNSSIALFASYANDQQGIGERTLYYGGQVDQFFVRRPFGGFLDPFISVSAGAYYRDHVVPLVSNDQIHLSGTRFALAPGGGIRLPFPNRFQLRGDVKDLIIFRNRRGLETTDKTTHSLLVQAGLGLTF